MNWKLIAWIFIALFILETIFLAVAWKAGAEEINNENKCAMDICNAGITYDAYYYESGVCYCYRDNEIVYQKYLS